LQKDWEYDRACVFAEETRYLLVVVVVSYSHPQHEVVNSREFPLVLCVEKHPFGLLLRLVFEEPLQGFSIVLNRSHRVSVKSRYCEDIVTTPNLRSLVEVCRGDALRSSTYKKLIATNTIVQQNHLVHPRIWWRTCGFPWELES
jgi:hypothetical protein